MRLLFLILALALAGPPAKNTNPTAEALGCVNEKEGTYLVMKKDGEKLILLADLPTCELIVHNAKDGLYCRYHWDESSLEKDVKRPLGWFPTLLKSGKGIGPCPAPDLKVCLDLISDSSNGVVCTNSCSGWAVTNTATQEFCGSSVTIERCRKASKGAIKQWVCAYPGDGAGIKDQWVTTRIGPKCTYEGTHQSLEACNTTLLKKQ